MERYLKYVIVFLAGVLACLVFFLVRDYRALRHAQVVSMRTAWGNALIAHHAPLPASDANIVRSWMTFDYINKLFALSPDYLKTSLSITDPRYPHLSIASYAKSNNIKDGVTALNNVESALRAYGVSATSSSGQ